MLNAYYATVERVCEREGGVITQFLGDGVVVVFGGPLRPADDHARRAVRAAHLVAVGAGRTIPRCPASGGCSAGIGICTGDMVAGNIRANERVVYTIVGDAVNQAARLQVKTRDLGTAILVTASTQAAHGDRGRHLSAPRGRRAAARDRGAGRGVRGRGVSASPRRMMGRPALVAGLLLAMAAPGGASVLTPAVSGRRRGRGPQALRALAGQPGGVRAQVRTRPPHRLPHGPGDAPQPRRDGSQRASLRRARVYRRPGRRDRSRGRLYRGGDGGESERLPARDPRRRGRGSAHARQRARSRGARLRGDRFAGGAARGGGPAAPRPAVQGASGGVGRGPRRGVRRRARAGPLGRAPRRSRAPPDRLDVRGRRAVRRVRRTLRRPGDDARPGALRVAGGDEGGGRRGGGRVSGSELLRRRRRERRAPHRRAARRR